MAWIESYQELKDHPKTKRFARALGITIPQAVGHLHCLWWWALDYAPDGELSDYDALDIAEAAMWDGDPEAFLEALVNCGPGKASGFIDRDNGSLWLHDWDDYGNQHKKRQADARRKRKSREERAKQNESQDSHVTVTGHSENVTGDRTGEDRRGQTGAEKRRPSELIADESVTPQRFYEVAWGQVVGPTVDAVIEDFEDELEPSAIKWAIWEARLSDARGPSYIRRICKRLASEGLRTAEAAEQNERARRAVRNGQPRGDPKPQYYAPGQDPNKELVE